MKVLPTLQLRQGRSIAHLSGAMEEDPREQLAALLEAGYHRFCFVDVDAAEGQGNNRSLIADLIRQCRTGATRACVQVGGGIRGSDHAQFFLDQGATWLLVGTLLYRSPMAVEQLLARFHEHLTAAIDVKRGLVKSNGWSLCADQSVADVARHVKTLGFRRLLFVDVPDGSDRSPDFSMANHVGEHARLPLFMWSLFRSFADYQGASAVSGLQGVQVDAAFALSHADALRSQAMGC